MKKIFFLFSASVFCTSAFAQQTNNVASMENAIESSVGSFVTVNTETTPQEVTYKEEIYKTSDGGTGTLLRFEDNTAEQQNVFVPEISVYPNPSTGIFTLETNIESPKEVIVYDILGNIVYSVSNVLTKYPQVDLSSKSKGVYFVKIISGDIIKVNRIILQ